MKELTCGGMACSSTMEEKLPNELIGARVLRGPDWKWAKQDG